jgi:hypothetical protein
MTIMPEPHSVFLPRLSTSGTTTASTAFSSDRGMTKMQTGDGDIGVLSTHGHGAGFDMNAGSLGSAA